MFVLVFPACQNGWQAAKMNEQCLLDYKTQTPFTGRLALPSV